MRQSHMISDYMVSESVNRSIRSINHSPTSGIVHKQRGSYGPRLTLLNKWTDPSLLKEQTKQQSQQYIEKILLLSLEISRLNNLNETLRKDSVKQEMNSSKLINASRQLNVLRESNDTLKIAIKTLQSSLMKGEEQKSRIKVTYQSRINQLQLQLNNYAWKVQQYQKQLQKLRKQKYEYELQVQRIRVQKTRQQMSQSRMMNKEKNIQAEKSYQIHKLKQTIQKQQKQVSEFRYSIKQMREENQKLSRRETQLLLANQEYACQFQEIKKRIDYDLVTTGVNTNVQQSDLSKYQTLSADYKALIRSMEEAEHQLRAKDHQLIQKEQQLRDNDLQMKQKDHQLRQKLYQLNQVIQQLQQAKHQFHQRQATISELRQTITQQKQNISQLKQTISQLKQNNMDFRNNYEQLYKQFNQKDFYQHKKITQIQENHKLQLKQSQTYIHSLNQQLEKVILESDLLKQIIAEQRATIQLKNIENSANNFQLNDKLKKTQRKLKTAQKLSTTRKDSQNIYFLNQGNYGNNLNSPNTRLFKSRSIESTSFFTSRKAIDLSLENIVTTTVALQGSNERSMRLITKSQQKLIKSFVSPVKHKRKVFMAVNGDKSQQSSQISSSEVQKKTKHKYSRMTNKKQEADNMKSSIHEYYGDINA